LAALLTRLPAAGNFKRKIELEEPNVEQTDEQLEQQQKLGFLKVAFRAALNQLDHCQVSSVDITGAGIAPLWIIFEHAPDRHGCGFTEPQYRVHTKDGDIYAGTKPCTLNMFVSVLERDKAIDDLVAHVAAHLAACPVVHTRIRISRIWGRLRNR
jgi:hypothetical protein